MAEPYPELSVIVAMSNNRVIGRNNSLPWHLPADLTFFKRVTLNKPMIMGRKTFESIGCALPGRTSIVVTHQPDWQADSVVVANSLPQAIEQAVADAVARQANEVMVIGGAGIFEQVLPLCGKIYLTEVHTELEGDTFFPAIDPNLWREVSREYRPADEKHAYGLSFIQLKR